MADAGDGLLALRIAEDKAVVGGPVAQFPAGAVVGEGGAEKVDVRPPLPQVDSQAGLVLAAPGPGHIGLGEFLSVLRQGVVPDGLLLGAGAVAAHRYDGGPAARGGEQLLQHGPGPGVEPDLGMAAVHGHQGLRLRLSGQGVGPVHQIQGAPHAPTASPISLSSSWGKSRPIPFIMLG